MFYNTQKKPCVGLVFRFRHTSFVASGAYTERKSFTPMKRLSCNCEKCIGLFEAYYENIAIGDSILIDTNLKNNDLCKLVIHEVSKDIETGLVDSLTLKFVKYNG